MIGDRKVMYMFLLEPWPMEELYGKNLIAFGTGWMGKTVIPYLAQDPSIKLHGVTNSRITEEDAGTFQSTGLPLRSLETWAKLMPDATILTCVHQKYLKEVWEFCRAAGFKNIISTPPYLLSMLCTLYNPMCSPTGHPYLRLACLANEICDTHKETFAEFKGCHRGQTVAVIATGPSLNYYSQIKGVPHIGVNSSFLKEDLKLNYYFAIGYTEEWGKQLKNYSFVKFIGKNLWTYASSIPEQYPEYIIEENNARRFFIGDPMGEPYADLIHQPLMSGTTIVFAAIQFAMFTRPKRLLLIGCDCSSDGHYDSKPFAMEGEKFFFSINQANSEWIKGYKHIKAFAERVYPDMEVISVNPVGLKGLFHDMYTESYLDSHPELDRKKCEIIHPEKFKEN